MLGLVHFGVFSRDLYSKESIGDLSAASGSELNLGFGRVLG